MPSAIQRVTRTIAARGAGRPLDSLLAVRILDARGGELPGAAVRWEVASAGEGAALRRLDSVTDADGVSRAAFTPGRSANVQVVAADMAGVGRIEFSVTVPAASARIAPDHAFLWSGNDTVFTAMLHDAAGTPLDGGEVAWGIRDTAVARLERVDGTRARIIGVRAGDTEVLAFAAAGSVRATARVSVRPTIHGRFVRLDGTAPPAMRAEVRSEGVRETVTVSDGAFTARVAMDAAAPAFIHASPVGDAGVHTVTLRVDDHRDLQELVIALVPTSFRIAGGTYDGQVVPIDAAAAMRRVGNGAPFWRLVPYSGRGARKLLGWREAAYPLRLAFHRAGSREAITSEDSAAFWAIARRMERDLGRPLLAAANGAAGDETGIVRVEVASQSSEGHTFVSWEQSGDASDGVVLFRRAATLRDPQVVTHELVHLLGFGHAADWPTIALPAGGTRTGLSVEDVAYMQLGMRLRALQERTGARPGLPVPSAAPR